MAASGEPFPVEKFTCGVFAGMVGLLLASLFLTRIEPLPTAADLVPRVKMDSRIHRPRLPYGPSPAAGGHFSDPFAPDVAGFRNPDYYERRIQARADPGRRATATPPSPGPRQPQNQPVKVTLPPLPAAPRGEAQPAGGRPAEPPAPPPEPKLPGPVAGIVQRRGGALVALLRPEDWSVEVAALGKGDEWNYRGQLFRIVDITRTRVTVRDAAGLVKSFAVDGGAAKEAAPAAVDPDEAQTLELLGKLLRNKYAGGQGDS